MNFTVFVSPDRHGFNEFKVAREGSKITAYPENARGYRPGYELDMSSPDKFMLAAPDREYRIEMTPTGVRVDDPRNDGMRGGPADLYIQTPLKPEQYQTFGLSIASSLMGIPLPPQLLEA